MDRVGFRDLCPDCSAYLHSCVQCRLYVKDRCTEPQAEKVRDPGAGNYCDWFQAGVEGSSPDDPGKRSGRSEAEELWRKLKGKS